VILVNMLMKLLLPRLLIRKFTIKLQELTGPPEPIARMQGVAHGDI